jgi:S-(hydroxymethyl)glutathione dehydrogenase/alcohol dehydrogenase
MRAAVLNQIPGPLEVAEIEIDDPGPREVRVRVVASGLCHSDLHFMEGKYDHKTPVVLGHEAAGVVEAVGRDVAGLRPGDHVVACLSVFCGRCPECLSGRPALCDAPERERAPEQPPRLSRGGVPVQQFAHLAAFAEEMLVHEHALVKIRPEMPLDRAALIGCAVTTGVGAVINTARVPTGSTVAVLGCGGVGLNCVQGAALAGASRIIAVDTLAWKLELARTFGATDVVDASEEDAVGAVREMTGGGVEYSFEAIGLKLTAEQSFAMLRAGGTATLIGLIPEGQKIELMGTDFLSERRIQGSSMGSNRFRIDIPRFVEFYLAGKLKLDELISARIGLDDVNAGYEALKQGEVARSVIVFGDEQPTSASVRS